MHDGFAMLGSFMRLTESYTLNTAIHLNHEEVLLGQKASVLLRPSLFINGRTASLELLKNAKVTLTTLNFTDKVPVTKTFENLQISNSKEIVVDFQVPPYLEQVSVVFSCEIKNLTKQTTESFSSSETFNVGTHQHDLLMNEFYLRKEGQYKYVLYLLGKNGEPKQHHAVNIGTTSTKTDHYNNNMNKISDKQGRIVL